MTPGARLSAAIECLDTILGGAAAEKTLTTWARRSRYAGSKDRAAVRDLVFDAIRMRESCAHVGGCVRADLAKNGDRAQAHDAIGDVAQPSELQAQDRKLSGQHSNKGGSSQRLLPATLQEVNLTGRALILGLCALQDMDAPALFAAGGYGPKELSTDEIATWEARADRIAEARALWNMPEAAIEALQRRHGDDAFDIARTLMNRAPVDLRVNSRAATREQAAKTLAQADIKTQTLDTAPTALRVLDGARKVRNALAYLDGQVELQDAGSQKLVDHILTATKAIPRKRILDYCAGGGGKSLALAAKLDAETIAHDIDPNRMRDIPLRASRAGVTITCATGETLLNLPKFDLVLCDAPCSGSGSWRRAPEAKWRFDASQLFHMQTLQFDVLSAAATHLAPGGMLAYATCSLFEEENEHLTKRFLEEHAHLELKSELTLTPLEGTDGFYIALMV